MEIVLHLGVHRTGTTSTQAALDARAGLLAAQGIRAITPRDIRPPPKGGGIAQLRRSAPARALSARMAARDAERQGVRLLVLSDENLLGPAAWLFPRPRAASVGLPPMPRTRALYPEAGWRLRLLALALRPWPVRAVVTFRGYAEWSESLFAHVCRHRPVAGFDVAKPRIFSATGRWPHLIGEIVSAFPVADAARYEDLAGDEHAMLARLVGAEAARLCMRGAAKWRNRSMPAEAVEALVARWRRPDAPEQAEREAIVAEHSRPDAPRFAPWTRDEREQLTALYEDDMAAIAGMGLETRARREAE
ncbi:hypothetical protein H0I76_05155 [Limibaculum sp. M0105]|uniref:Uncharacterized protein n=1 Tax=Thermohalobaculum xanthum TaxID=2753746 RepID=A0A8J7SD22_9RHOB|nr:hypothetical protein [Thermohalobaculum xanthum]MBK0398566.1 hypothetical protein [Thermohalobaculum xanthum]